MSLLIENRRLLDSFRKGETNAMQTVYEHYFRTVETFVAGGWYNPRSHTRSYGVADIELQAELVQEIFVRAFSEKTRLSYDGIRPYKVFLLSIARNVIVDYLRKRPKDALSHICLVQEGDSNTCDEVMIGWHADQREEELDWERCLNATSNYVSKLDETLQRFVHLRFREELTLVEVARQLGVTRGKARFLEKDLGRGLKKHLQTLNLSVNWRTG